MSVGRTAQSQLSAQVVHGVSDHALNYNIHVFWDRYRSNVGTAGAKTAVPDVENLASELAVERNNDYSAIAAGGAAADDQQVAVVDANAIE